MEYKEFIINVGLRYDALDPNSRYPDPSRKLLYQYDGQAYAPSDLSQLSEQQMQQADWGYAAIDDDGVPSTFIPFFSNSSVSFNGVCPPN